MSHNTVAQHYAVLLEKAMPKGASDIQLRESKRMFYAGAGAVLNMLLLDIADPKVSEAAGVQMIAGLHEEVAVFMDEVIAGRA